MRLWMDGIGTAFDATTAKDARKRYRALLQKKVEKDEILSYGIIKSSELKYPKAFCTIQMEKPGKSLGKIK